MMEDNPTYTSYVKELLKPTDFKEVARQIKVALETDTNSSNPVELIEKIKELSLLTASAAALQANAKKNLLKKELELIKEYQKATMPPSVLMRMITAETYEESSWLVYSERLNAGMTHALDGLRSSLSFLKAEMETTRNI